MHYSIINAAEQPYQALLIKCFHCEKCFSCEDYRTIHIILDHQKKSSLHHEEIKKTCPCALCNETFSTKNQLAYHMRSIHVKKKLNTVFTCPICGRTFKHSGFLTVHARKIHAPFKTIETNPTPVPIRSYIPPTHIPFYTSSSNIPTKHVTPLNTPLLESSIILPKLSNVYDDNLNANVLKEWLFALDQK